MAVAAGVICLGGVVHSQRFPQSFNSCSAVAMPEVADCWPDVRSEVLRSQEYASFNAVRN